MMNKYVNLIIIQSMLGGSSTLNPQMQNGCFSVFYFIFILNNLKGILEKKEKRRSKRGRAAHVTSFSSNFTSANIVVVQGVRI
jgi:hypothetical protein